jgi:hypothetical protein
MRVIISDKQYLDSMSRKPEIVTAAWLVNSLRQQKMVSTQNYIVIDALKLYPAVVHQPVATVMKQASEECESGFLKLNLNTKSAKRKPKELETSILPNRSLKKRDATNDSTDPKNSISLSPALPFTGLQFCLRFSKFPDHLSRLSGRIESNGGVILERSLNLDPSVFVVVPFMYFQ